MLCMVSFKLIVLTIASIITTMMTSWRGNPFHIHERNSCMVGSHQKGSVLRSFDDCFDVEPEGAFGEKMEWLVTSYYATFLGLTSLGLYSLSSRPKTSYRQISRSLEAARLDVTITVSLWTAAELPVKIQSDWKSLNPSLMASRLHEILR